LEDRPAPPHGAVVLHDLRFAGEPTAEKLVRIRTEIAKLKRMPRRLRSAIGLLIFNIRGSDVEHTR